MTDSGTKRQQRNHQRKQRALVLLAAGRTVAEVARELAVGERTVQRWRAEFADQIRDLQEQELGSLLGELRAASLEALTALRETVRDRQHPSRVQAAARILDAFVRLLQVYDLQREIAELRREVALLKGIDDAPGTRTLA